MKKTILTFSLLLFMSFIFTSMAEKEDYVNNQTIENCTLSASGNVASPDADTEIIITLTVSGPCDINLTRQLRQLIAETRAKFLEE